MPRTYKPVVQPWRACPVCNAAFKGRTDRLYCGDRCRKRAARGLKINPPNLLTPASESVTLAI